MSDSYAPHRCTSSEGVALANALADVPETVFAAQLLRRELCLAYLRGGPADYSAAMVEVFPGQLLGFGEDTHTLSELLRSVRDWKSLGIASHHADTLRKMIARDSGKLVQIRDAVFFVLCSPVTFVTHPAVRLLEAGDVDLLLTGPGGTVGYAHGSPEKLLAEGVTAGALVEGQLVARAHTSCHSARYADVAIATREEWRGHGLATATAGLVCERVQRDGRIPIWSTDSDNRASRRVAEKLGFVEWSRVTYISVDAPHH